MSDPLYSALRSYPYLVSNILGIPAVVLAFVLLRGQRRMMLFSGIIPTLMSPVAVLHEHE